MIRPPKWTLFLSLILIISSCSQTEMLTPENWGRIVIKKGGAFKTPPEPSSRYGRTLPLSYICNKNIKYSNGDYELIECSTYEFSGLSRNGQMGNLSPEEAAEAMKIVNRIQEVEKVNLVPKFLHCLSQREPSQSSPFVLEISPPYPESMEKETIPIYRSHPSSEKLFEELFIFMRKQAANRGPILPLLGENPQLGSQETLFKSLHKERQKELGSPAALDRKETWKPLPEKDPS